MADVQLLGINKAFGDTPVLSDIAVDVRDGEFVVIVGPSGSGKSTLLRIIAGLDAPDSGEVMIGGKSANGQGPAERGVAMVFQSYALYPQMSVYDNMAFGLKLAGAPKADIDAAVRAAAKALSIDHLLSRKPRALSGGQRQRVAIGRAIVRRPRLFLLDEPLSNLDAALRVRMRYEFIKLRRELGATTIYVTHDQIEAMTLADKIVVLGDGAIRQIGAPLELYRRPANLFVAGFIGSPKMNFLAGVAASAQTVRLLSGEMVAVPNCAMQPGDRVTLGVRPEHLTPDAGEGVISGKVEFVEQLGNAAFAHARSQSAADEIVVSLAPDASVRVGETLRLGVLTAAILVFDAEGEAIGPASGVERP